MRTIKILTTAICMSCISVVFAQSDESNANNNSSKETVTKIIRIKGPNGEEKVIKKQEVITKKAKIKLNPDDQDKTNQTAIYGDEEVAIQKSHSASDMAKYSKISDGKGYVMTFFNKSGNKVSKVRPVSSGYYIVNLGNKDNGLGHFDKDKNFIVETYDSNVDKVITTIYKAN